MSYALGALKAVVMVVNIVIAIISVLSIYTVASGQFNVILPGPDDIDWSFEGTVVTFETEATIMNGGFYAVQDLNINVTVTNESGYTFVDYQNYVPHVPAHTTETIPIQVPFDLGELSTAALEHLAFSGDTMTVAIDVSAYYTMKLIEFTADYDISEPWHPLIESWDVGTPEINTSSSSSPILTVPVSVKTSFGGNADASFSIENDKGKTIAKTSQPVALSLDGTEKDLTFTISDNHAEDLMTRSQTLGIDFDVGMFGSSFSQHYDYDWGAPLNNLQIGKITSTGSQANILTVPFGFTNDGPVNLNLQISTTVTNDSAGGSVVGQGQESLYVPSGSPVDDAVVINLSPGETIDPNSKYTITLHFEGDGIDYIMTQNYP